MLLATLVGVAGCAGDGAAATLNVRSVVTSAPSSMPPAPSSATPTTSTTSTTTTPPPTTLPPTTLPPTTTLPSLPVPVPAPPEDGSSEPRIEIGSIEIPRIGLSRQLFEGIRLATLDNGPGHWPGTALPGEPGNVVVAGHRVSHNRDFRNIDQLVAGDEVIMSTLSGRHVYRVVSTEVVQPDAVWIIDQTPGRTATLFACHPPGSVRERIVVHLELAA